MGGDGSPIINQMRHREAEVPAALATELGTISERTAPADLPRKVAAAAKAKAELLAFCKLTGTAQSSIEG
jgi:hypothetical protein